MAKNDERDFSAIIKIDGTTKAGAQKVVAGAITAAQKHAPGGRGSFIIAPTKSLAGGPELKSLPSGGARDRDKPKRCKEIKVDGKRCTFPALEGNYGFCGRHR